MEQNKATIEIGKVDFFVLGQLSEGVIEPREDQLDRLEEVTERVGSGEFHVTTSVVLPVGNIYDRYCHDVVPNSVGGTESIVIADDLINKQFKANDESIESAFRNIIRFLIKNGKNVGGYDTFMINDEHAGGGMYDKPDQLYAMIVKRSEEIRAVAESIGVMVDDETNELICTNAAAREVFSTRSELAAILDEYVGIEKIDDFPRTHNEVLAVINRRAGKTLDRAALRQAFGSKYEVFNVDVWSFQEAANTISTTKNAYEAQQKIAAMTYYNLASLLALGGPGLRMIVLE